jgi:hypothetical protein
MDSRGGATSRGKKKGAPRKKEPLAGWGLPAELKDEQFARSLKGANFMRIKDN